MKTIFVRGSKEERRSTPIDSDKEFKNKLWKFLKAKVKIWGYEGPFILFLLLIIIGGILYYWSIKEILYHPLVSDGGRTVVSHENGEMKQGEAEGDDEYNASESEQIALTNEEEVEEQPREASDAFRDKESKNNLQKLLEKKIEIWGYVGPFINFLVLVSIVVLLIGGILMNFLQIVVTKMRSFISSKLLN